MCQLQVVAVLNLKQDSIVICAHFNQMYICTYSPHGNLLFLSNHCYRLLKLAINFQNLYQSEEVLVYGSKRKAILGPREEESWTTLPT